MGVLKGVVKGIAKSALGITRFASGVLFLIVLAAALFSCERDFQNPYLPDNGNYAGSDWSRDFDGDGLADSVEKYVPGCQGGPDVCLRRAQAIARGKPDPGPGPKIKSLDSVVAEDLSLVAGGELAVPVFQWFPPDINEVTWSLASSDPGVADISGGKIRPLTPGNTNITLTVAAEGAPRSTVFRVTVNRKVVRVAAVSAQDMVLSTMAGASAKRQAPVIAWTPADPDDKGYTLVSHNLFVATIRGGEVEAVMPGFATVTLKTHDGGFTTTFQVKVVLVDLGGGEKGNGEKGGSGGNGGNGKNDGKDEPGGKGKGGG